MDEIQKRIKKIHPMLVAKITANMEIIKSIGKYCNYYNRILIDISPILSYLLDLLLITNCEEWDKSKWIDDGLITDIEIKNEKLTMRGIMIWGRGGTTKQWTDPFYFEIQLPCTNSSKLIFLFCDVSSPELTYEKYRKYRDRWKFEPAHWKYKVSLN